MYTYDITMLRLAGVRAPILLYAGVVCKFLVLHTLTQSHVGMLVAVGLDLDPARPTSPVSLMPLSMNGILMRFSTANFGCVGAGQSDEEADGVDQGDGEHCVMMSPD